MEKEKNVRIEFITKHTVTTEKHRFNSNNHDNRPDNYEQVLDACNTKTWIDCFRPQYARFEIDEIEMDWLVSAAEAGAVLGHFPSTFKEELSDFLKKYEICFQNTITTSTLSPHQQQSPWFVKSENVSLKYGMHGVGPYTCLKNILESAVSCPLSHSPFSKHIRQKTNEQAMRSEPPVCFYCMPWLQELDPMREFRVFVFDKHVTAISQQIWYTVAEFNSDEMIKMAKQIAEFVEKQVMPKLPLLDHVVLDIGFLNDKPFFIEPNSFGAQYAAGSALFHWKFDHDILHNTNEIVCRMLVKDNDDFDDDDEDYKK